MNTALTSQTLPTQPIRTLLINTQGTLIGWWVGNMTGGDSSGGKKGGSEEVQRGGAREWCYGSSVHFISPFAQDMTGNLQNKSCHLRVTGLLRTKLLSAEWQMGQSLREFACCNLALSHIPDVSMSEAKELALNPQTGNERECRSFPWDGGLSCRQ